MGFVNVANGDLDLEFPLASMPQRGRVGYTAKLIYDSRIWQIGGTPPTWQPTNWMPPSGAGLPGGWYFSTTADKGNTNWIATTTACGANAYTVYTPFAWQAPDGTQHIFAISTRQDNWRAGQLAQRRCLCHGLQRLPHVCHQFHPGQGLRAGRNTGAWRSSTSHNVEDTNGNFSSSDVNGNTVDTLNRTVVTESTGGGWQVYFDVLNSQGSTSRYTLT